LFALCHRLTNPLAGDELEQEIDRIVDVYMEVRKSMTLEQVLEKT